MKYPIGVQTFEKLRNEGYVYVDKTALVYKMAQEGSCYFLSRPRRFGKSLLLSTLKAYFEGKRDLFQGLAIAELEAEWNAYPVLHLDLNAKSFSNIQNLYDLLNDQLTIYEQKYGCVPVDKSPEGRFRQLIRSARAKTGKDVVVLIDEYDKPILQAVGNESLQDEFRNALKAFYGVLKSADAELRFTLLTGVTKFGKVSVFSDLNNLNDISTDTRYGELCGISEHELHEYFDDEIAELAAANAQTKEQAYAELRTRYDGYQFSASSQGIYNPFSVLSTLEKKCYDNYWFATGTPIYLVELLKKSNFHLPDLGNIESDIDSLNSIHSADLDPIPVLFQSGYLTIKGYDKEFELYHLDFPNEEVKHGFIKFLLPYYTYCQTSQHKTIIRELVKSLSTGDAERFMQQMQSVLADTPYDIVKDLENHYQNVMYIVTKLLGFYVQAEYRTSRGRIDLLIKTDQYIYVIELKHEGSAEEALSQINAKDYIFPFTQDSRQLIKIGANISRETRNLDRWVVEVNE